MKAKIALLAVAMVASGVVNANEGPKVEYSADSYMESAETIQKGTVHSAPGKERREYDVDGNKSVMIMRRDKSVTWILQPEAKTYMEMKMPKEGRKDDISAYKIDQTTVGPETVNGVKTTKSKIIMAGPNGDKLAGFYWTTKEGIVVKMDAIAVDKNSKERFKTELKNLKVGKQAASLFEVPSDYEKMDMGMGGLGKMMFGGDDDEKDDDDEGSKNTQQPKKKEKGFNWRDAVDLIK